MDDTRRSNDLSAETGPRGAKRPWQAPVLRRHESLTVLTQSIAGPGLPFLLQIGCSVVGGCSPNPNRVPGAPGAGPMGGPGGGSPYHGPYPQ